MNLKILSSQLPLVCEMSPGFGKGNTDFEGLFSIQPFVCMNTKVDSTIEGRPSMKCSLLGPPSALGGK